MLPGISTEQLRSRLHRMVADGLLTRQRYREVPPRVDYELTERSRALMPVIGALARWGYDWTWSEPRKGEAVDIGAIIRLAPGLLRVPQSVRGTVALDATATGGRACTYLLSASHGEVSVTEGPDPVDADAQVSGAHEAWVTAFGPDGSLAGLEITGDEALAERLLAGFAGQVPRAIAEAC